MGMLGRTAVLAAIAALGMAPAAGFGQEAAPVPPVEQAPNPGGGPTAPQGQPPAPVLPLPDAQPRTDPGSGMRGADCEHERAPGIGV
jgi:hypothetical protein